MYEDIVISNAFNLNKHFFFFFSFFLYYVLRTTYYVLRTTYCVLRTTHYVLRTAYYVLRNITVLLCQPLFDCCDVACRASNISTFDPINSFFCQNVANGLYLAVTHPLLCIETIL